MTLHHTIDAITATSTDKLKPCFLFIFYVSIFALECPLETHKFINLSRSLSVAHQHPVCAMIVFFAVDNRFFAATSNWKKLKKSALKIEFFWWAREGIAMNCVCAVVGSIERQSSVNIAEFYDDINEARWFNWVGSEQIIWNFKEFSKNSHPRSHLTISQLFFFILRQITIFFLNVNNKKRTKGYFLLFFPLWLLVPWAYLSELEIQCEPQKIPYVKKNPLTLERKK